MKDKNLLIIFTRNPELGTCKTRLAASIGDQAALDIYVFLLKHTVKVTTHLAVTKRVYYSEMVRKNDLWSDNIFDKYQQKGDDLGARMYRAFYEGFNAGYKHICIIGSDLYDITTTELQEAFYKLKQHDAVIGPATDGGYYLLGLNKLNQDIFTNKEWGGDSILKETLNDLKTMNVALLGEKNDVDYYEDIKDIEAFQPFLTAAKL